MIPDRVLPHIASGSLPLYVYDAGVARDRAAEAASLLDRCYYPIKACPVEAVVRAAIDAGCGVDLCSAGDAEIARAVGCVGSMWSFTSAHAPRALLRELAVAEAVFDADSEEQMREWQGVGGSVCGIRVASSDGGSSYGVKFGVLPHRVAPLVEKYAREGLRVIGLHTHQSNTSSTTGEWAAQIEATLAGTGESVLRECRYINIGGGWPLRDGWPARTGEMREALGLLRVQLAARGFSGILAGEPGEWVVGPAGYWAASVSTVKQHPRDPSRAIVILDTSTPVPCRPSAAPFILVRNGAIVASQSSSHVHDVYGSANTGADAIGLGVLLPEVQRGDVVVALCQGAYARSLTGSFNERPLPGVAVV